MDASAKLKCVGSVADQLQCLCVCVPKNEFQAAEEPPTHLGRYNLELSFIFVPDAMMNLVPALSLYIPKLPALGIIPAIATTIEARAHYGLPIPIYIPIPPVCSQQAS